MPVQLNSEAPYHISKPKSLLTIFSPGCSMPTNAQMNFLLITHNKNGYQKLAVCTKCSITLFQNQNYKIIPISINLNLMLFASTASICCHFWNVHAVLNIFSPTHSSAYVYGILLPNTVCVFFSDKNFGRIQVVHATVINFTVSNSIIFYRGALPYRKNL